MSFNLIKITWIDIIKDWVIHGIAQHFCNTLEITRSLVHEPWLLLNLIIIVQLYTFAELKRKRSQRSFHLWKRNLLGKTARDNIEWLPNWPTCILFTKTLFFTFCLQKYEEITYILLLFDNCPCSIRSHQKHEITCCKICILKIQEVWESHAGINSWPMSSSPQKANQSLITNQPSVLNKAVQYSTAAQNLEPSA